MAMKKWISWAVIAIALIAALVWAFRPRATIVETALTQRGMFEQTINEDGLIRVRSRYLVASPTAGLAERIVLRVGDSIKPGDRIATIRPLPPALQNARMVSELKEALGAAQASELRASAQVSRVRAAVQKARSDYWRANKLADQGFTARSQAESARLVLAQQTQALRASEFEFEAARHQTEMARAALQRSDGSKATKLQSTGLVAVNSPVTGRVLKVLHESEGPVSPGTSLVEIGDTNQLEAVIDVLSEDATQLRPGMSVRLAAGREFASMSGRVTRIEPIARTQVSTLGVEEQRVNVVVTFQTPDMELPLGDGYRVDASIVTKAVNDAILVPIGALVRASKGWKVFVVKDGRAVVSRVNVKARNGTSVWLESGVREGDPVIVYPPDSLSVGDRVAFDQISRQPVD